MRKKIKSIVFMPCIILAMVFAVACSKGNNNELPTPLDTVPSDNTWQTQHTEPTTETQNEPSSETETPEESVTETSTETNETETQTTTQEDTQTTPAVPEIITPEIGPAYPSVYPDTKPWDLINNEVLNPRKSGNSELDGLCESFLIKLKNDGVINDEMTQYQYFRAIYVWYMDHIEYDRTLVDDPGRSAYSDPATTPEEILWASGLFNTYKGCCYNYSASFMYLMRYIGYDAHLLSGQVGSYNGGYTPHCWVYINFNGIPYTFDPDVDMNYYWRDKNAGKEELRSDVWFCRKMNDPNVQYFYQIEKEYFN